MKTNRVLAVGVLLAALFAMLQTSLSAAAQDDQDNNADPPGRVADMNFSQGSVSFQPGGEGDWVTAVSNRPLTTGDNLWADKDSRAELHVGSTSLRMGAETSLTFLDLDDRTTQLRVSLGTLLVRVKHLDDGDTFEIDTPNLAFDVQNPGEYRVDVNADGNQTVITAWNGRGEVTGGGSSYDVVAGQQAQFNGTDKLDYDIAQLPASDDFDTWAFNRDRQEDHADSANYISTEVTGYSDLDEYGHWRYVAGYGTVWAPDRVDADWAPYRDGHWVWIEPWGWTWVDDEPWGFAPFHYGRWAFATGGWFWVPGPVVVRPVYAPALVAFVGGGGFHFSVSVGGGPGVGWFPLAPGEVYVPSYRASREYVNVVNVTNTRVNVVQVTNVYNTYNSNGNAHITYVNQHVNNGVTVVSHDTFVNARPVSRNIVRVDQREIIQAPVSHRVEVQPDRSSVIGAGAAARFHPPAAVVNRQVVVTRTPAAPRQPFEQRREQVNVRTETPSPVQMPRPTARPAMASQPDRAPNAPEAARPATPDNAPRPGQTAMTPPHNEHTPPQAVPNPYQRPQNQQQENNRPNQLPQNQTPQNQPNTAQQTAPRPNPLVRQAPPVQNRTPDQERNDESKFRTWQQQRQQQRPEPEKPAPKQQPQHSEHNDHHDDKPKH